MRFSALWIRAANFAGKSRIDVQIVGGLDGSQLRSGCVGIVIGVRVRVLNPI